MLKASVSNLECFRIWMEEDDLDVGWVMERLLGRVEQTKQQHAGEMLHKALEQVQLIGEVRELEADGYRFVFDADCQMVLSPLVEYKAEAQYGDLLVTGRIDSIVGTTIVDYKSGDRFDPDRLLSSYQWRFYLDMMGARRFEWRWFGLDEVMPKLYHIKDFQRLTEITYPGLHEDCMKLAQDYLTFAREIPALNHAVTA